MINQKEGEPLIQRFARTKTLGVAGSVLGALALSTGCAVLTESQIEEVHRFASAAKDYGALPGGPIKQYGELSKRNRVLRLSETTFSSEGEAAQGWERIQKALAVEKQFADSSEEADQAINVLTNYAEGLQTLTAKDPLDDLDKAAANFGTSLDKALTQYNTLVRKPQQKEDLKLVGSAVAGSIRATGGIFVRSKQAEYVKSYVGEADSMVKAIAAGIGTLMSAVESSLEIQRARLEENFKTLSVRRNMLDPDTVIMISESLAQIDASVELCKKAKSAAATLSVVHSKLVAMVDKRQDLKARLEEIETLVDQIKAGLKTRKDLAK